jgi:hypothetical protein
VASVAAARAIATAVAVVSSLARAARVPVEEAAQEQLDPKDCLNRPGIYVYHVGCLTVTFIDTKSGQMYHQPWCVVKVGKAADNTIDQRLQTEDSDIRKWRCSPNPRITAKSLGNDDVGDLVACFTGSDWVGYEKEIREFLGIRIGKGKLVHELSKIALAQMRSEHPNVNEKNWDQQGKIQVWGWTRYFKKGSGEEGNESVGKSQIGPSELIIMPKAAMEDLRDAFKSNPAHFASIPGDVNVVGKTGPAWDHVRDASKALPNASDWHDELVAVRFETDDLIGPIGPLTLQLWDSEQAEKQKQNSPNKAPTKKCKNCGHQNPCAQRTCKAKGCNSSSFIKKPKGSAKKKEG